MQDVHAVEGVEDQRQLRNLRSRLEYVATSVSIASWTSCTRLSLYSAVRLLLGGVEPRQLARTVRLLLLKSPKGGHHELEEVQLVQRHKAELKQSGRCVVGAPVGVLGKGSHEATRLHWGRLGTATAGDPAH